MFDTFLRDNLYALKFDYGTMIAINHLVSSEVNVLTGIKTQETQRIIVNRAIKLPELFERDSIGIGKGPVDVGSAEFIIDRSDTDSFPELTASDWIDESGGRYQVQSVEDISGYGWVVVARRLSGAVPEPINESAGNSLGVANDVE